MSILPSSVLPNGPVLTTGALGDPDGEALRAIEVRLTQAKTALLAPSASQDALLAKSEGRASIVRQLDSVFDAAERILEKAKLKHQRKL